MLKQYSRLFILLLSVSCTMLCSCQTHTDSGEEQIDSDSSKVSVSESDSSANTAASFRKLQLSDITKAEKSTCSQYHNPIVYYSADEARSAIERATKYRIADNCKLNIPKEINHVSTFRKMYPQQDELSDYYDEFLQMYQYLFPGEAMDDTALFYYGANSTNTDGDDQLKTIGNQFDQFSGEAKEDVYFMFYSPCFYEGQTFPTGEKNKFLELSSPVGTIMTNFNKGVLAEYISEKKSAENRYFLETYTNPNQFSEFDPQTGTFKGFASTEFAIESEAVHTMLDGKELSVRDAVSLFEDYINTLPYPQNPNLDVKITSVSAVEIDHGKYCYAFDCAVAYEGIMFDYMPYGSIVLGGGNDGYEPNVRMGYMSHSNDVDAAYGFCRSVVIADKQDTAEIVPFEDALRCCADNMSGYADWELRSAELVYCAGKGKKADAPYQDQAYNVSPSYKFVLYNANDDLCYSTFVNAISGEFERYYKTK